MIPKIVKATSLNEVWTSERCFIYENYGVTAGDENISIARARVEPNGTTKAHHLEGVQEIYLITKGKGRVTVGELKDVDVSEGDVVVIPPGITQKIQNVGDADLVFYCICTPSFDKKLYHEDE
ncbi:MAG: cupin domain-containing protein [Candidatus Bathyarchaeota archaeon]|nr:cupin domain-containing protein [Candidatus Bathyarchaeota archaeon]